MTNGSTNVVVVTNVATEAGKQVNLISLAKANLVTLINQTSTLQLTNTLNVAPVVVPG